MRLGFPGKRLFLSIHKWLGITSAFFLMILSFTGLALNHTEQFGLDKVEIRSSWILGRYGMIGENALISFKINNSYVVSKFGSMIFLNDEFIGEDDKIAGVYTDENFMVVVTSRRLTLLTSEGELIEVMNTQQFGFEEFLGLGESDQGLPVFITDKGLYTTDSDWIRLFPFEGSFVTKLLTPVEIPEDQRKQVMSSYQGTSISLYRVILDLHSGRLFGWGGKTLMDLSALAILLLVSSGIVGWLRRSMIAMEVKKNEP